MAAKPSPWFTPLALAALCLVHAWLALSATREKTTTVDEVAHLAAGRALWRGDYRLQPENGVLPQLWEGLPAHLQDVPFPAANHPAWHPISVWRLGDAYFHQLGNDLAAILWNGRAMNLAWSIGCGLLIFVWTNRLFGRGGAWFAALLWAFCPTFLAHGALATSDMAVTFFLLLSVAAWWAYLQRPTWGTLARSGAAMGLAFVAKYTAVLLPAMAALLILVRLASREPLTWHGVSQTTWRKAALLLGSVVAHVVLVAAVIWAFHGFRFAPVAAPAGADLYGHAWADLRTGMGEPAGRILDWLRAHRVLPDAYLYGFGFVLDYARERGAFLHGETSLTGWPHFFPYAFLVKTPLPVLLALAAAAGIAVSRWRVTPGRVRADLYRLAPLLVLSGVYWAVSITSSLNIGHRHLLPIYPAVFIATGALGWAATRRSFRWWGVAVALVACQVSASTSVRPHYLAFFNTLAGGPAQGYRHLVDSSLDWGQDLPGLAVWLAEHQLPRPETPVFLAYFGTGSPEYHGIRATPMVPILRRVPDQPWHALQPGVYCISATLLQQAYSPIRGPWTSEREQEFQRLRATEPALLHYHLHPGERPALQETIPGPHWEAMWKRYEQLRFTRLCTLLRARTPEAQIGYSINVYVVSEAEIAAVQGPITTWRSAIEAAARR